MSTFNLHNFILNGLKDAVGKMADYQIILNAAGWHEKGVLQEEDLALLENLIEVKNTIPEISEEITEEIVEE
jgi:hypothetical protein